MLSDVVQSWTMAVKMTEVSTIVMLFYYMALAPSIFGLFLYAPYFYKDSVDARSRLPLACALFIFVNFIEYVGMVFGAIFSENIPYGSIMTFIPVNGLGAWMYFYFRMICIQWKQMGPSIQSLQQP